jgi:hypothetical protein
VSEPDFGPLREAVAELEAFERGELGLDHYAIMVPPEQLPNGSWTVGWPDYRPAMDRLWAAFWAADAMATPEAYLEWLARKEPPLQQPEEAATLPRDELVGRLFAIRRGERFCDGHWLSALELGFFLAFARRLLALAD